MYNINIVTIFPEAFPGILDISVLSKAREKGIWKLSTTDIKKFADNKNSIDDTPFGGGPGMIMKADTLQKAYESALQSFQGDNINDIEKIILTPSGIGLNQKTIEGFSKKKGMILICGRYEGVDERFIEFNNLKRVSIGNYVIAGGEAAAVVLSESVIRLLPDVLGNSDSKKIESFNNGLLEYPQYTKPRIWKNIAVPEILLSGNHKKVSEWREKKSIEVTKSRLKK